MAPRKTREPGQIPEWAKTGPVTISNYDLRAEWTMLVASKRPDTPYLRLPHRCAEDEVVADLNGWLEYWLCHLGGLPRLPQMFVEEHIGALNVPEDQPELFDPSFERDPRWRVSVPDLVERLWRGRARPFKPVEHDNLLVPSLGIRINYHDHFIGGRS